MRPTPLGDFPASVFVLDALLCMAVIGASRFGERALFRARSTLRERDARRTLIVGAGRSGRSLLRELRETPGERVVGFVDDDPRLHRRRLLGVPVRGGTLDIERILDAAAARHGARHHPAGPGRPPRRRRARLRRRRTSPAGSSAARPTSTPSRCSAPRRVTHDGGRAAATQLPAAAEDVADRLTNAVPVVVAFLWLCVLYGWQTRGHVTPWLFTDELKYTQIARSIAETGRRLGAAPLGRPSTRSTPTSIAPFWRIHDVHTAYSAIKYFGVIVMTAAIFPTYLLARMVVSRSWALFAAVGAVADAGPRVRLVHDRGAARVPGRCPLAPA